MDAQTEKFLLNRFGMHTNISRRWAYDQVAHVKLINFNSILLLIKETSDCSCEVDGIYGEPLAKHEVSLAS